MATTLEYKDLFRRDDLTAQWVFETVSLIPPALRPHFYNEYQKRTTYKIDNKFWAEVVYLGEIGRRFEKLSKELDKLHVGYSSTDDDMANVAKLHARICKRAPLKIAIDYAKRKMIVPPKLPKSPTITDKLKAHARLSDDGWWLRKIRVKHRRAIEKHAIAIGCVSAKSSIYVSGAALGSYREQNARNAAILAMLEGVSDWGDVVSMDDIAASGLANPIKRRAELMVRMRGFEEYAKSRHCVGMFYTITAPSKYHAVHKQSGQLNTKYQELTPKEAQQSLCKSWARARAKMMRAGINVYGFRVVEPNHDATPHWHLLLFVDKSKAAHLTEIIRHYATEEDSAELYTPARQNARFTAKTIDPKRGSATGYIAKYIAKNVGAIDGAGMQFDLYGNDIGSYCERIRAWASCWSIRQFQQIGGAPVGLWRELRRIDYRLDDKTTEAARVAADGSRWDLFLEAIGGATVKRKALPIFIVKQTEAERGKYGDDIKKIIGIASKNGDFYQSRFKTWTIQRRDSANSAQSAPWSTDNNCTRDYSREYEIFTNLQQEQQRNDEQYQFNEYAIEENARCSRSLF